jgi:hypothetical protein
VPTAGSRFVLEKLIVADLAETGSEDVDWIHPAQERDQWRALVSTKMNLQVT